MKRTIAGLLAVGLILAACSHDEKSPETPIEKNLDRLTSDLDDGVLTQVNDMSGEQVGLSMEYRTDYDVKSWRITDSKTLAFSAHLTGEPPAGTTVLIEHVHVDVALDARKAGVDGIKQDSMDDSLHTGTSEGFLVSAQYPYEDVFAIEGYSDTLISGWGFIAGSYGQSDLSEKRLTENNLRKHGDVTGNKITFIYDVLIRYAPDQPFHKRVVTDEFIIPIG